jgi:hypothetical protein
MRLLNISPFRPFRSHRPWPGFLGLVSTVLALAAVGPLEPKVEAGTGPILEVVRSFCLSAFETELAQAGKSAPEGMANYACSCVTDRIAAGNSIAAARSSCRAATSRRYPI